MSDQDLVSNQEISDIPVDPTVDEGGFYGDEVIRSKKPIVIANRNYPTDAALIIFDVLLPDILNKFLDKNAEYGDHADGLGLKGQYAEIHRKIGKLKKALWDGQPLRFEQPDEVIDDMIGHLLLARYYLVMESVL